MRHAVNVIDGAVLSVCGRSVDPSRERVVPCDASTAATLSRAYRLVSCRACYDRIVNRARRFGYRIPDEED